MINYYIKKIENLIGKKNNVKIGIIGLSYREGVKEKAYSRSIELIRLLKKKGYDVFVSENLGNTWSKPLNLGAAINSVNNDTHFKYYADLKKAYIVGFEIVGQKSRMDIYEVDMTGFEFPKFY